MLVRVKELLEDANRNNHIVGFFEAWELYSLEAVIEAAEQLRVPVIAGFGESVINQQWFDRGGVEEVAALSKAAAERSSAAIGLIYNEVETIEHCLRGIHAGFNSVMLDSGHLESTEHRRHTAQLVPLAHALGAAVEAELGELPSADPAGTHGHGDGALTDPGEAAQFVKATGIDALSIAVGNIHLMTSGASEIDTGLIDSIYEATGIPLVLHGGSGLPEALMPQLRKSGVAKINVGTVLKQVFLDGMRAAIAESDESSTIHTRMGSRESTDLMNAGKERMKGEVARRLSLYTV